MTTVGRVMSSEVVSVAPDLSLRAVAELFAERHIGGAPVVAGTRLVGVVSASDILSFQASNPVVPAGRPDQVEDEFETPEPWQEDEEPPAAFFSDFYVDAGADTVERFEETLSPEWDLLAEHTVAEAMSRRAVTIGPEASAAAAARLMVRLQIHRVIVVDHGELRGVLTAMDLVRAVAEGRL